MTIQPENIRQVYSKICKDICDTTWYKVEQQVSYFVDSQVRAHISLDGYDTILDQVKSQLYDTLM